VDGSNNNAASENQELVIAGIIRLRQDKKKDATSLNAGKDAMRSFPYSLSRSFHDPMASFFKHATNALGFQQSFGLSQSNPV
jgi:hypothetical protein